jgi:hypothetical protein
VSKRFSESTRWDDPWYRGLKPILKNFWDFLCMRPDAAGVWKPDWEDVKFRIGGKINPNEALEKLNEGKNRIHVLNNGYWQILGWVQFQFGENLNEKIGQHKASICLIAKYIHFGYLEKPESYPKARLHITLVEKEKEVEIESNKYKYFDVLEFTAAFKHYIDMRKEIRKPATKRAEEMALDKLHKHPIDIAIKMLDQSTFNSWQGIYPIKPDNDQLKTIKQARFKRIADKGCPMCQGSGKMSGGTDCPCTQ